MVHVPCAMCMRTCTHGATVCKPASVPWYRTQDCIQNEAQALVGCNNFCINLLGHHKQPTYWGESSYPHWASKCSQTAANSRLDMATLATGLAHMALVRFFLVSDVATRQRDEPAEGPTPRMHKLMDGIGACPLLTQLLSTQHGRRQACRLPHTRP